MICCCCWPTHSCYYSFDTHTHFVVTLLLYIICCYIYIYFIPFVHFVIYICCYIVIVVVFTHLFVHFNLHFPVVVTHLVLMLVLAAFDEHRFVTLRFCWLLLHCCWFFVTFDYVDLLPFCYILNFDFVGPRSYIFVVIQFVTLFWWFVVVGDWQYTFLPNAPVLLSHWPDD